MHTILVRILLSNVMHMYSMTFIMSGANKWGDDYPSTIQSKGMYVVEKSLHPGSLLPESLVIPAVPLHSALLDTS